MTTQTTPSTSDTTSTPTGTDYRTRNRVLVSSLVAAIAGAAIVGGVAFGMGSHTAAAPAPAASSSSTTVMPAGTSGSGSSSGHSNHPVTPPVRPSQSVETLQRELGQLNYYEGPVSGFMNQQTVQAITYLQRDAHLPQTGQMNAATQTALVTMLAHGNNVMGA